MTGGGAPTGGGTATGGGAATGGSGPSPGAFFQLDVGVQYPKVVVGANGVFHLAYATEYTQTVVYATCAANCGVPTSWTYATLYSQSALGYTSNARLAVAADNRLHLVYERRRNSMDETLYATCTTGCTNPASWTSVDLTSLASFYSAEWRGAPLVVDSAGRVSFVISDLTVNSNLTLVTCGSNCTSLTNWQIGVMRQGGNRTWLAASGTTLHRIANDGNKRLRYATCASNCTQASSWTESGPLFVHDGATPTQIAVGATGRVTVAYNQGATDPAEPMNIQVQANKLIVWQCDANCGVDTSWSGVILGQVNDGSEGIALVELGGALVLALTQSVTLKAGVCAQNCTTGTNWTFGDVDDTTAMASQLDPYMVFLCSSSTRPSFAAWYPDDGAVAVSPINGEAVFVHSAYGLQTCGTTSGRRPASLRVVYSP